MKLRSLVVVVAAAASALCATARQGIDAFHGQTFSIDHLLAGPLTAGDWNSDGRVDLAFAFLDPYSPASTLQFVRGVGSGRLEVTATIPIAAKIVQLRAGDIEPDGDLDLVVATESNTLEVFSNQGDGTFVAAQATVGVAASSLALGDVDGDGDLDVVVASTASSARLLVWNGVAFSSPTTLTNVTPADGVELARVDSDAALDIVAWMRGATTVRTHRSTIPGDFDTAQLNPASGTTNLCALGDIDGDGRVDLVRAIESSGAVQVFANSGGAVFAPAVTSPSSGLTRDLTLADWNHDGRLDVITSTSSQFISVRLSTGPALDPEVQIPALDVNRLIAIDLDRDRHVDLVGESWTLSTIPMLGFAQRGVSVIPGGAPSSQLAHADLDGDGDRDLVMVGSSTTIALNDGAGAFVTTATAPASGTIHIADVNGDARPDVVVGNQLLRNLGAGVFSAPTAVLATGAPRALGDFDSDGAPDVLAVGASWGALNWWRNDGQGDFSQFGGVAWSGQAATHVAVGNVIGNNADDIVFGSPGGNEGQVVVLEATGAGTFVHSFTNTPFVPLGQPGEPAIADIDSDGDLDVIVPAAQGGWWTAAHRLLMRNDGGSLSHSTLWHASTFANRLVLGDVDSDGDLDILARRGPYVDVELNHGNGSFADSRALLGASSTLFAAPFDIDSDGDADIPFADPSALGVVVMRGRRFEAPQTYCAPTPSTSGCAPRISVVGQPSATSTAACNVTASDVRNQCLGELVYAHEAFDAPFRGGLLCVRPPIRRLDLQRSGGSTNTNDCSGAFSFDITAWIRSGLDPALTPGTEICCQYVARDPADPLARQLSDATRFTISP